MTQNTTAGDWTVRMVWADSLAPLRDFNSLEWRTEESAREDLLLDREHADEWFAFQLIRRNPDGTTEVVEA